MSFCVVMQLSLQTHGSEIVQKRLNAMQIRRFAYLMLFVLAWGFAVVVKKPSGKG